MNRTRSWLHGLFLSAAIALPAVGAGGCGGGPCADVCDYTLYCFWDYVPGCRVDDLDRERDRCLDECEYAFDRISDRDREEMSECIACMRDDIGPIDECRDGDYGDAYLDCISICNDPGPAEFNYYFDWTPDLRC